MPTSRARPEWQPYVRHLADRLGLKDWQVFVLDELPATDSAYARIEIPHGRKYANVTLSNNMLKGTEEEQRHAIVHELLHCHFAFGDRAARTMLSERDYGIYEDGFELGVDGVAVAIAPLLPLPSEVLDAHPANPDRE
jgi:hypothetical protein